MDRVCWWHVTSVVAKILIASSVNHIRQTCKHILATQDHIGLFKMFSCWNLGTFNSSKQSDSGWELTWVKPKVKDEAVEVIFVVTLAKTHRENILKRPIATVNTECMLLGHVINVKVVHVCRSLHILLHPYIGANYRPVFPWKLIIQNDRYDYMFYLTLKVLNFWKFTSYCSL